MAREVKEAMAHLVVCLGARGGDRRGLVGGSREQRRGLNGDEVVPVWERRQEVAGELRKVKVKLTGALGWLGWHCSSGSAVDRRSPESMEEERWCLLELKYS